MSGFRFQGLWVFAFVDWVFRACRVSRFMGLIGFSRLRALYVAFRDYKEPSGTLRNTLYFISVHSLHFCFHVCCTYLCRSSPLSKKVRRAPAHGLTDNNWWISQTIGYQP